VIDLKMHGENMKLIWQTVYSLTLRQRSTDRLTDKQVGRKTDGCGLHTRCPFSPREDGLILPPVEHFRMADQNSIRDRCSYFFLKDGSESNLT